MSGLDWHFTDYPETYFENGERVSEMVLCKTIDNELMICEWDGKHWLDVGRDRMWFDLGIACWAYVKVPYTTKQMPFPNAESKRVRPYPERTVDEQ